MSLIYSPGPCAYNLPSSFGGSSKGPVLRGKQKELRQAHPVGPGQYGVPNLDSLSTRPTTPKFTLRSRPSSRTQQFLESSLLDTPAPGHYRTDSHGSMGTSGPRPLLRGKREYKTMTESPGPIYNVKAFVPEGPRYTIQGKGKEEKLEDRAPAPGHYEVPSLIGSDSHRAPIIRGKREEKMEVTPGAGMYAVDISPTSTYPKAPSFTIRPRPQDYGSVGQILGTPAPGHYEIKSQLGEAPAPSIRGKPTFKTEEFPGPGTYNPALPDDGPKISLRGRPESPLDSIRSLDVPAPGTYELGTTIGQGPAPILRGKPKFSTTSHSPGVGTYKIPPLPIGPQFSISSKLGTSVYAATTNPLLHIDSYKGPTTRQPMPLSARSAVSTSQVASSGSFSPDDSYASYSRSYGSSQGHLLSL